MTIDRTLTALADPSRREVVERLRRGPLRSGELAAALGVSRPAMSRHLKVLRASGLVAREHDDGDARATVYRLRPAPLVALRSWLEDVERFWSGQLDGFVAHAERRPGRRAR